MLPGSRVKLEPPDLARYSRYTDYLDDFEQYVRLQVSLGRYVLSPGTVDTTRCPTCLSDSGVAQDSSASSTSIATTELEHDNRKGHIRPKRRGRRRSGTRRRDRRDGNGTSPARESTPDTPLPAKQLLLHEARLSGVSLETGERPESPPLRSYSWARSPGLNSVLQDTNAFPWITRAMLCKPLPDVQTGSIPPIPVVRKFLEDVLDEEGLLRLILSGRVPKSYKSLARLRSQLTRIRFRLNLGLRDTSRH